MSRPAPTGQSPMSETPPIGTPFHAVILQPLSDKFPVTGEVVIGKILNEQGDFRLRSRHSGPFQQTEEFCNSHLVRIRIVPDTDKPKCAPKRLNDKPWKRHVREKHGSAWLHGR